MYRQLAVVAGKRVVVVYLRPPVVTNDSHKTTSDSYIHTYYKPEHDDGIQGFFIRFLCFLSFTALITDGRQILIVGLTVIARRYIIIHTHIHVRACAHTCRYHQKFSRRVQRMATVLPR